MLAATSDDSTRQLLQAIMHAWQYREVWPGD